MNVLNCEWSGKNNHFEKFIFFLLDPLFSKFSKRGNL
jgi:hypothetical protein